MSTGAGDFEKGDRAKEKARKKFQKGERQKEKKRGKKRKIKKTRREGNWKTKKVNQKVNDPPGRWNELSFSGNQKGEDSRKPGGACPSTGGPEAGTRLRKIGPAREG